jgi:hypothetical protein
MEESTLTKRAERFTIETGVPISPTNLRGTSVDDLKSLERFLITEAPTLEAPAAPVRASSGGKSLTQLRAILWQKWKEAQSAQPGINRHAITQKALGSNVPVNEMDAKQLGRCIEVFSAITRKEPAL